MLQPCLVGSELSKGSTDLHACTPFVLQGHHFVYWRTTCRIMNKQKDSVRGGVCFFQEICDSGELFRGNDRLLVKN